jgi:hypothetical protein
MICVHLQKAAQRQITAWDTVFKQTEEATMDIKIVPIENPKQLNLILGQSHFIKTVEDLHEAMVSTVPGAK